MRRSLLPLLCGAALLCLAPQQVRAHAIETEVHLHAPDGRVLPAGSAAAGLQASAGAASRSVELESHFSNGEAVRDAAVRLIPGSGAAPIELGRTDAAGRLAFTLPRQAGAEAELQVDGGPGHRDWVEIPRAADLARKPLPAAPGQAAAAPLLALGPLAAAGLLGGAVVIRRRRARS